MSAHEEMITEYKKLKTLNEILSNELNQIF